MALALATLAAGLFGTVVRAPATPVCRASTPCSAPAAHAILVFVRGGFVGWVKTDSQGRYRITLAPGTYSVRLQGHSRIGRLTPFSVTVRRGTMLHRNFAFDSGIR